MSQKHTLDELNNLSREELITMVLMMQGQLDTLNDNIEKLIEQVRLANSYRFGRHSEKLSVIDGQMSFFDEADAMYDDSAVEPEADEVICVRKKKTKGQRELDLKEFPVEGFGIEHKERTPETIADMFGLTKERVRQIIKISIEKIQHIKINKFK